MTVLYRTKTEFNADGVSWCPFDGYKSWLACCMYELTENSKIGGIEFRKFENLAQPPTSSTTHSTSAGVFRISWARDTLMQPFLYTALTNGFINAIQLDQSDPPSLKFDSKISENTLLCLDLSSPTVPDSILSSDDSGRVFVTKLDSSNPANSDSWPAHSFFGSNSVEVWSVAFDKQCQNVVYSGADDSLFKGWDLRCSTDPIFVNKSHASGVTKILSHAKHAGVLATGSYDEKIRLWDSRSLKTTVAEVETLGSVWDFQWNSSKPEYLLAACMQGGWQIFRRSASGLKAVANSVELKNSLLYGVSWCSLDSSIFATCSFYDRSLDINVWQPPV